MGITLFEDERTHAPNETVMDDGRVIAVGELSMRGLIDEAGPKQESQSDTIDVATPPTQPHTYHFPGEYTG